MSYKEPRIVTSRNSVGNAILVFEGEHFPGDGILDTKVKIEGNNLCCITWADKDKFINEINDIISKYSI